MDRLGLVEFDGHGFNNRKKCIYGITIRNGNKKAYVYIGKTGSSNESGISSPFERLATHFRKSGNTRSLFHDHDVLNKIQDDSKIRFIYYYCTDGRAESGEKYLIAHFKNGQSNVTCLNKEVPATATEVPSKVEAEPLDNFIKRVLSP